MYKVGTTAGVHMCACLEWLYVCSDFVFVCFVHLYFDCSCVGVPSDCMKDGLCGRMFLVQP